MAKLEKLRDLILLFPHTTYKTVFTWHFISITLEQILILLFNNVLILQ